MRTIRTQSVTLTHILNPAPTPPHPAPGGVAKPVPSPPHPAPPL
jgi:hypothetical protein